MEHELDNGIFIVMRSECGDISQTAYDSSHKTLEAARTYMTKESESVSDYDDTNFWVFEAIGVAKRPDERKAEYYSATYTPPKPRASRKKSASRKKTSRKKTARKKASAF